MHPVDSEASAERRLLAVQRSAGLQWESAPQQILSHSNDAWLVKPKDRGACVLRVAWRGWVGQMLTESSLAASLPAVVGSPEVLASGSSRLGDLRLAWSLSRRLSGTTLAEAWPQLGARRRRAAGESIARRLRALHAWRPPSSLAARLLERPRPETPDSVVGTTITPLPMERLALLVEPAAD